MDAVIEKWEEILQTVKSEYEVTDVPFNTWLKPLKVYEVDGKLITVVVPSEQAAIGVNYISKRYKNARFTSFWKKISPKKQKKTLLMINRFRIHVTKRRI